MPNKRKQRKKIQKPIVFDENKLVQVIPGMLKSAEVLLEFGATLGDNNLYEFSMGYIVSTTIITAQCCELLLKYKAQLEGNKIEPIHELYELFTSLSEESQKEIENEYKTNISTLPDSDSPPEGWETVDSIFRRANDALIYWRYSVTVDNTQRIIYPRALHITAISIYATTPIANLRSIGTEVTDPEFWQNYRQVNNSNVVQRK